MPILWNEEGGGTLLAIHLSGTLVKADYERFVPEFERLLRQRGKLRVLFDITDFHGLELGALWEEAKFDIKHAGDINRLAVVGDKKWQHVMAMISKPFTTATVHYFDAANAADARKWLSEA